MEMTTKIDVEIEKCIEVEKELNRNLEEKKGVETHAMKRQIIENMNKAALLFKISKIFD